MVSASADMSTKFGMGLNEAGNTIAKAVNNPEMMRRLGMQLKIDPDTVKHIQDLAKHGNESAARLELISVIEGKIGGAAKAAFDADPLAKFNKVINSMKIGFGEAAIKIQTKLAPALIGLAKVFKWLFEAVSTTINFVIAHWDWFAVAAGVITTLTLAIKAQAIWTAIATKATAIWTGVQTVFNAICSANPILLIVIGIAALVFLIYKAIKGYNEWGAALMFVMGPLGMIVNLIMSFKRHWQSIVDAFSHDGILGGLKRIGIVLLDAVLYPVQQLLELLSKIPGLGNLAGAGVDKLKHIRASLELVTPDEKKPAIQKLIEEKEKGKTNAKSGAGAIPENIASGGSRSSAVYITFKNMVENMTFEGGVKENATEIEREITQIFHRMLYMAAESA